MYLAVCVFDWQVCKPITLMLRTSHSLNLGFLAPKNKNKKKTATAINPTEVWKISGGLYRLSSVILQHVHSYTITYIHVTCDDPLSCFTRTHLGHRGMTSWEEMSESQQFRCCHSAPLPAIHIHSASLRSFLLVCRAEQQLPKILISRVMTSLSGPHQSAFILWDRQWQLTIGYSSRNLLSSPFIHTCIQIEKFGDAQRRTNRITHTASLAPTQTHSSTISSQRDCTHSNKQRRLLLSECNYLVLSISLTAVGQRALCWWG